MCRRPHTYAHIVHAHGLLAIAATAIATGHAVYQIQCFIHGYHVYHRIWLPIIDKVLGTGKTSERENEHDRYAVAVLEEETCCVVRHLPRLIRRESNFFLRTGGTITVEVTERRWRPDKRGSG